VLVSRYMCQVRLAESCCEKVQRCRQYVEKLLEEQKIVYGLTTGFGKFSDKYISNEQAKELQINLIRSHAFGIGDPFPKEVVRAIILLRVNALLYGNSGIRLEVIEMMVQMLNKNV